MDGPGRAGVLADRRFVLLSGARMVSVFGNGLGRVALAFGVLALPPASPAKLSLVLAAQALPQLALVLVGGLLGDRFARCQVMVVAELLAGAGYLGLAVMVLTARAPMPALLIAAGLAGVGTALFLPSANGIVAEFIEPAQLQSANSWLRMSQNLGLVCGLAISGVLVALIGPGWALMIDAGSFLISAVLIAAMALPRLARGSSSSGWVELRLGWREFSSRQWLWVVVVQFAVMLAAANATVGVLGPSLAQRDLGGARVWALLIGAQAAGTVLGAGAARKLRVRRPILVAVLVTVGFAAPMFTLGLGAPLLISGLVMFGCGVASDIFGVLWATTMQREIPEELLSRVSAYDLFGSIAFAPLGLVIAGPVASVVGLRAALVGCGCVALLATGAALLSPAVRGLRAPPVSMPASASVQAALKDSA